MVIVFTIFNVQTGDTFLSVAFKFTWYGSAPFAYSQPQIIIYTVSKEQKMLGRSIASVDIVHHLSLDSRLKKDATVLFQVHLFGTDTSSALPTVSNVGF